MRRRALVAATVLLLALAAAAMLGAVGVAQSTGTEAPRAASPTVTFELEWAEADPHWYQLSVDEAGNAEYKSLPKVGADETPGEAYVQRFTLTDKTRQRIFGLASAANQFAGDFAYKGSTRMAKTGEKTLRYENGGKVTSTSFNYSENKNIMELVGVFQSIATTVELGHELRKARRFDKLGVDAILRRLEDLYSSNNAIEIQAIAPVLQQILDDRATMNMARERAKSLLASIGR